MKTEAEVRSRLANIRKEPVSEDTIDNLLNTTQQGELLWVLDEQD